MPDTLVTFPAGETAGIGRIELILPLGEGSAGAVAVPDDIRAVHADTALIGVVLDRTPFHPVDASWPDQPADTGTLAGFPVVACLTAARAPDGAVAAGGAITARRGAEGYQWWVLHLLPEALAGQLGDGQDVEVVVDARRRSGLSRGHTACHLAALALNSELADQWSKPVERLDSLGNPDLDSLAIVDSRIEPDASYDAYRLGKGIRRKGLDTAAIRDALPQLSAGVNKRLADWVTRGGAVRVDTGGDESLTARRTWIATLPEAEGRIPCGGTHVKNLAELGEVTVSYEPTDEGFVAHTTVSPPPTPPGP